VVKRPSTAYQTQAEYFSPLGKLADRAIYFVNVFSLFFYFLMVDFLDPVAQKLMDQSSPKFQDL